MHKTMSYVAIFLLAYFGVGGILFNHLWRPPTPDYTNFFHQNQRIGSQVEGLWQSINRVEGQTVSSQITLEPRAPGPPLHLHEGFDEYFVVEKGTLSLLINGEKKILKTGESITIWRGTPHRPFNETNEPVILNDSTRQGTLPACFVFGLAHLYSRMDKAGRSDSPRVLLQLAALGNDFDTWTPDVPLSVQKTIRWLLAPTAYLAGYSVNP